MTESFRPAPQEVSKISKKDKIVSALKSERGEIRVGDTGGFILLAGIFLVSEGTTKNSTVEIALGSGMTGVVLLEALITSLRKK